MPRSILPPSSSLLEKIPAPVAAVWNRMPWFWRRVAVGSILIWSMGLLTYLAIVGTESTRQDIAFYVSGVLVSTMASYLGIAAVDHQNERRANLAAAAINPPPESKAEPDTTTTVDVKV